MRRFILFLGAACVIMSQSALAQLNLNVIIRQPMPSELSEWQRDRTIIQVVITNTGQQSYTSVRISFSVKDGESNRVLLSSQDNHPEIPRFDILAGQTIVRNGLDVVNRNAVTIDNAIRNVVITTNRLPEGNYQFCVRLLAQNGSEIAATGAGCQSFIIVIPDPPTLLQPENNASIPQGSLPTFSWTPVYISPGVQSQYKLRIAPILEGQTERIALDQNTPLLDQQLTTSTFTYPPSAPQFSSRPTAIGFAWQVQAVDSRGVPVARNEGKSEIWKFTVQSGPPSSLSIRPYYPLDNDTIPWLPPHLVFQFDPYSDNITAMRMTLSVRGSDGSSFTTNPPTTNSWPDGPRIGQRLPPGGEGERRARLLIANLLNESSLEPWMNRLQRGVQYTWSVNATFTQNRTPVPVSFAPVKFTFGMRQPLNVSPPDGTRFSPDTTIVLSWKSPRPIELNPPLLRGVRRGQQGVAFGSADERYRLEVSRSADFINTVAKDSARVSDIADCVTGEQCATLFTERSFRLQNVRDPGVYYWRVSWLRDDAARTPYVVSPTWRFIVGGVAPPPVAGRCADECSTPITLNPVSTTRVFSVGDTLKIGRFQLGLTSVRGTGAALSGEGTILIPYFFNQQVLVEFRDVKVNMDSTIFEGVVTGKQAPSSPVTPLIANQLGSALGLDSAQIKRVYDVASSANRIISASSNALWDMPIGLDKEISGYHVILGIMGLVFRPTDARLNAVIGVTIPALGPNVGVGLGARNICFHPNGLGGDGKATLYLPFDEGYRKPGSWGLVLKGQTQSDSGTYVSWDCEHGFLEMRISAQAEFPRDWFTPLPDNGSSLVKATFKTTIRDPGRIEWIASASMDSCAVTSVPGFKLNVQEMAVDFSSVENPRGMVFPEGYLGTKDNTWEGFYLGRASVTLPEQLQTFESGPPAISVQNMIITRSGFSAKFVAAPVIQYPRANLGDWAGSLDSISVDIVNNSLRQGRITGKIRLPIAAQHLKYTARLVRLRANELTYLFNVVPGSKIDVPLWIAKMELKPTSRIYISNDNPERKFRASATLHGTLSIDRDYQKIPKLLLQGVKFQNFKINSSQPYFEAGTWSLASPEKELAGFPLTLNDVKFVTGDRGGTFVAGIEFDAGLHLHGGAEGISGTTKFTIWGKPELSGGLHFSYHSAELNDIAVTATAGPVRFNGQLTLYRNDQTFGTGFRGSVRLAVLEKSGFDVSATAQFGRVSGYRYWYVDAKALFSPGIPIEPGIALYGFGGGMWYNMERDVSINPGAPTSNGTAGPEPGATASGFKLRPREGPFGFRAAVTVATHPSPEAFNADVAMEVYFRSSFSFQSIVFVGSGYMMAGITPRERENAKVTCNAAISYDFPTRTLHGEMEAIINADPVTGRGSMTFHIDPDVWYIKIGEPSNRIHLKLAFLEGTGYLMVGKNLPLGFSRNPRDRRIETGNGFALGEEASARTGRQRAYHVFGEATITVGFDIMVSKQERCVGINGWYARGQLYGSAQAELGVYDLTVKIPYPCWSRGICYEKVGIKGDKVVFSFSAGVTLQWGTPNPTWAKVTIGYEHLSFNFVLPPWGEVCE